jgi:hypothetical protein
VSIGHGYFHHVYLQEDEVRAGQVTGYQMLTRESEVSAFCHGAHEAIEKVRLVNRRLRREDFSRMPSRNVARHFVANNAVMTQLLAYYALTGHEVSDYIVGQLRARIGDRVFEFADVLAALTGYDISHLESFCEMEDWLRICRWYRRTGRVSAALSKKVHQHARL